MRCWSVRCTRRRLLHRSRLCHPSAPGARCASKTARPLTRGGSRSTTMESGAPSATTIGTTTTRRWCAASSASAGAQLSALLTSGTVQDPSGWTMSSAAAASRSSTHALTMGGEDTIAAIMRTRAWYAPPCRRLLLHPCLHLRRHCLPQQLLWLLLGSLRCHRRRRDRRRRRRRHRRHRHRHRPPRRRHHRRCPPHPAASAARWRRAARAAGPTSPADAAATCT